MAVWPTFNLAITLRDGFLKTGLSPFSPEIIRATVKPVAATPVRFLPGISSPLKKKLRSVLTELDLPEHEISNTLALVDSKVRGISTPLQTVQVFHSLLLSGRTEKQKRVKDPRLHTDSGRIMTESEAIKALEDRNTEAAKKSGAAAEKKRKKAADIAEGPAKRAPRRKKALPVSKENTT